MADLFKILQPLRHTPALFHTPDLPMWEKLEKQLKGHLAKEWPF